MIKNIVKVARKKSEEIRPRRKRLGRFGSHTVGVRQNTVDAYEV
jgi:hypothetical protein